MVLHWVLFGIGVRVGESCLSVLKVVGVALEGCGWWIDVACACVCVWCFSRMASWRDVISVACWTSNTAKERFLTVQHVATVPVAWCVLPHW